MHRTQADVYESGRPAGDLSIGGTCLRAARPIWPVCVSTSLDYYRRHGLFFDAYDEAALAASFLAQTADGARTCAFKFATDEAVAQARAAIEAGTFLNSELSPHTSSYSYTVSDTLRIIKLYW